MFPTFIPFTSRHPRYVAVMGFSIFVLGFVLFSYVHIERQQSGTINPALQAPTTEELKEVELSLPVPTAEEVKALGIVLVPTAEEVKALGIVPVPTAEEREAVDTAIEGALMKNR